MSATDLNAMFTTYGNAGNHWTGADATTSVALPDGRVVWLFSDTFLGTVNADLSRPASTPMINNSAVIQDGTTLTQTLHGGTAAEPRALVEPQVGSEFYWVADGTVEGGKLKVLYNRMRRDGEGTLDFALTGTALATFELPSLTLSSVVDLPVGSAVNWGSALLTEGSYTYVYGTEAAPGRMKFAHVARVAAGDLGGAWQFWTGSAWSADPSASGPLLSGVGTAYSVQKIGSQYVLVTHENNLLFDPQIVAYTAASPTGPFTGPRQLYTAPEVTIGGDTVVYDVRVHSELARDGKLLLSYNVNSLEFADQLADVRLYRPRFVEIGWPLPDPSSQPAAPTGVTVVATQDDAADLSWTAAAGATGYRIYQRDVTGGQTHFARQRNVITTTSYRAGLLIPGHRYEFKVAAVDGSGEGPTGSVAEATPHSSKSAVDVIGLAGSPGAIAGTYIISLRRAAVPVEHVERFGRQLLAQHGGTFDSGLPNTVHGFSALLTEAQARDLASHPDVEYVEQNHIWTLYGGGEQTEPGLPWHLDRIDQKPTKLDGFYRFPADGSGVTAYVVDTGVKADHPEFGGRVLPGYNSVLRNTDTSDCNGHGTAVAGALAGGRSGVAKGAKIVPVRASVECASLTLDALPVYRGIEWVSSDAQLRRAQHLGPAVMNLSFGGLDIGGLRAKVIGDAVRKVMSQGITVVIAAGNTGGDFCAATPQNVDGAIVVGGSTKTDRRRTASSYGACVDIWAPSELLDLPALDGGTAQFTGTSGAAPQVAGAAAILLSQHPDYSPDAVQKALIEASGTGMVADVGASKSGLLYIAQPPHQAPQNLVATPNDNGTVGLQWDAVDGAGVHYIVSSRDVTAGETDFVPWDEPVFDATSTTSRELVVGHLYEFVVAAANAYGTGPQSAVASATPRLAPPPKPTGLTATAAADGTINLQWNSLGDYVWYWVYQKDLTAQETEYTRLEIPITEGTSMTAGFLIHGHEYEFRVSGSNRGGEGPQSDPAQATSSYPPPSAPTGLTAENGDGQVILRWTASTTQNVWYHVYQRDVTAGEPEFRKLDLPVEGTTMTAGFLTNGKTYEFRVTTTYFGRESAPSNTVQGRPQVPLPGQVTGLTATAQTDGTIALSWTAPGPNLWFDVYQRDVTAGESAFRKLDLPVTTCCAFTAGFLVHNHTYEFKIAATNAAGAGPQSAPASATARYSPPPAPKNLRGEQAGDATIHLEWEPPASGDLLYWVYQRDVTAGQQTFAKLGLPTSRTEADLGFLAHDHVYEFKVTAENQGGEGPASNTVQATAKGGVPAAPTGLTATAGDGKVTLHWTASSTPSVTYNIYQRDATNKQAWQKLPLPISGTMLVADFLTNGNTYEFRVTASNFAGTSGLSNVASARPLPPLPATPTGLFATAGDGQVTLRWDSAGSNVHYWIEMRPTGGTWNRLPYPVPTCCTFTPTLLNNGTTYEFRIFANNLAGDSGPSNVVSARPMPPFPQPPSNLSVTAGDGQVKLTWTASSTGGVGYYIEMRAKGGAWQRLPYAVNTTTYTVNLLTNGTVYEFQVRATNLSGVSNPTNVVSARPMPPAPQSPSDLQGTRAYSSSDQADLAWTASPTRGVLYNVYMRQASASGGAGWQKLPLSIPATALQVAYLTYGHTYDFYVTAVNITGESGPTNTVVILAIPLDSDRRCASEASNYLFNHLGGFEPFQRYDVTGRVCGTRSNYTFKVEQSWSSEYKLLEGIFWYTLVDCDTFQAVWTDNMPYETGGPKGGSKVSYVQLNPSKRYSLRVFGAGSTEFMGGVYTRFSNFPPPRIIPFDAHTQCF